MAGGPSNLKYPGNTPPDYQAMFGDGQTKLADLLKQAPVGQPDLSDPNIQAARQAQLLTSQLRRGRSKAFSGVQQQPDLLGVPVGNKALLGG